jgi:exonuclease 1
MGIKNLFPFLEDYKTANVGIETFSGLTVGIDAFWWLHRGAWATPKDFIDGKIFKNWIYEAKHLGYGINIYLGKPSATRKLVEFIERRIKKLKAYKITPYFVFDGNCLPQKEPVRQKRISDRSKNIKEAENLALQGTSLKWLLGESTKSKNIYKRAIEITPYHVHDVIDCLKKNVIKYIVAPFEADAQLAYLYKCGTIDMVFTGDSDLLPYGVKKIFVEKESPWGDEYDLTCLSEVKKWDMTFANEDSFLSMWILGGWDYLPKIKNLGFIKLGKEFLRSEQNIKVMIKNLRKKGCEVPLDYYQGDIFI